MKFVESPIPVIVLISVCLLFAYWPIRTLEFVNYDDDRYVTNNPRVQSGLTWENITWAFSTMTVSNWHPVTWHSHMWDCELFGLNPLGHHLMSLAIHLSNGILVFLVFRRFTGNGLGSATFAGVFLLHPLSVESVAWISERKNVLCTLFWLLSILAYLRYVKKPCWSRYLLLCLFFVLGLLTKPMVVTLPFVLLLLDYWPLGRIDIAHKKQSRGSKDLILSGGNVIPLGQIIGEKIPLLLLAVTSGLITLAAQKAGTAVVSIQEFQLKTRLANAAVAYVTYLFKIIWPSTLAVPYPHPGDSILGWQFPASGLLILSITTLAFWQGRKFPSFLVSWLWFAGTLIPVSGLIQVGEQAMADRYVYIPLIGILLVALTGFEKLTRYRQNISYLLCAVLIFLAFLTRRQVSVWRDSFSLFQHAVAVTKRNYIAHNNLGLAYDAAGMVNEAILEFAKSIETVPTAGSYNNLGLAFAKKKMFPQSEACYERALSLNANQAEVQYNWGLALQLQGKYKESIEHLRQALLLRPSLSEAYAQMGVALIAEKRFFEAIESLRSALALRKEPFSYFNLAIAQTMVGNLAGGRESCREALKLKPDFKEARDKLKLLSEISPKDSVSR